MILVWKGFFIDMTAILYRLATVLLSDNITVIRGCGVLRLQERIRRARRKAGYSQAELAEMLKVKRSAVSNWESVTDVQPSMTNLIAIAEVCEVSLEWLGTGRGGRSGETEALADIPAADAELVDAADERELLAAWRALPRRSQQLLLELANALQGPRRRGPLV